MQPHVIEERIVALELFIRTCASVLTVYALIDYRCGQALRLVQDFVGLYTHLDVEDYSDAQHPSVLIALSLNLVFTTSKYVSLPFICIVIETTFLLELTCTTQRSLWPCTLRSTQKLVELMAFKFLSDHHAPSKQFCTSLISSFHASALNSCADGGHEAVMKEVAMRVSQLQELVPATKAGVAIASHMHNLK